MRLPDRSPFKNEQIATLRFVFVLGKPGPSGEPLWMLVIRFHLLKEGAPGLIELDLDLIADFARQSLIGIRRLDQMIDSGVVEVDVLEDEGLAYIVVGQVPEVFGGKGHPIDALEARVTLADDMLLNQLHPVPPHDRPDAQ
jgi:hypothetical protein